MDNNKPIILFNDPDAILARVAKMKFQKQGGWNVIIATSYDNAITEFKKSKPKTLITEIRCSDGHGNTGFDLVKDVQNLDIDGDLSIVILTDLAQDEDKEQAKIHGADYYFVKSEISIKQLIEELRGIVK